MKSKVLTLACRALCDLVPCHLPDVLPALVSCIHQADTQPRALINAASGTTHGRLNDGPQRGLFLIPGNCENVTSHRGRDFTGLITVRILRWGDHFGFLGGPNAITRVFIRGKQESLSQRCGPGSIGQSQREKSENALLARFEDGQRAENLEKASEWLLPLGPPEESTPADTLILDPFKTHFGLLTSRTERL